jgi:hypothetical protein
MPRARNIKPGFFTNEVLADLPPLTRLLFIGLWTEADREGRLEDRPTRLKLRLFPMDKFDVNDALEQLSRKGFISRYLADGSQFIQILAWHKHQRPHVKEAPSTIPAEVLQSTNLGSGEHQPRQVLVPTKVVASTNLGSGEHQPRQVLVPTKVVASTNLGSGEPALIPDTGYLIPDIKRPLADRFAEFWDLYPRKDGKAAAEKVFRSQATSDKKADTIIDALRQQLPGLKARDPQYRPHARTWLSQKRWQDEPAEPEPKGEEYEFEYHKPFDFDRIKPTGPRGPDFPSLQELMDDFLEVAKEDVN